MGVCLDCRGRKVQAGVCVYVCGYVLGLHHATRNRSARDKLCLRKSLG